MKDGALRSLPRVDRVVALPALDDVKRAIGASAVTELVRRCIAKARRVAQDGGPCATADDIVDGVRTLAQAHLQARTRRVVNATGVVLHTNLGRAPLARSAVDALADTARGYVSLEIDLATGHRGGRAVFAETSLAQLAGAEAALLVNNNAAAVLLALSSIAAGGRGVLVSRGELVEIGGGFRVPEVLARSGARMIEVGTTNKTRAADYARALETEPDVAAILRVHPGNFRQLGFVERPPLDALARLAVQHSVALVEDLGGGLLVDLQVPGLELEPMVRASVDAGVDLVCFSTDKALGGPQGGAVVGRAPRIETLRRDPLARALRMGRLPLVALEATLSHLLRGELDAIPALAALRRPLSEVRARAEGWRIELASAGVACEVLDLDALAGGGAFAEESLASAGIALEGNAELLMACLREGQPPIVARIEGGRVVLDARSVLPDEESQMLRAVVDAVALHRA